MRGALPQGSDSYVCTGFQLGDLTRKNASSSIAYVTQFSPVEAASERAHHMILYACPKHDSGEEMWDCRHHRVRKTYQYQSLYLLIAGMSGSDAHITLKNDSDFHVNIFSWFAYKM